MVIVITGASSGIGLATGKLLTEKGFTVVGISRNPKSDAGFDGVACDITDFKAVETAFNEIKEKYGKIDVLINNAGMGIAGAIEHTTAEDLDKQFSLNVMALINACKCITPIMRSQGGGKIINIGSVAGVIPIPFQTAYATTKSAVDMFSMSYGLEVKDFGIKVSVVMPGDTKTGFTANRIKNEVLEDENYKERVSKSIQRMEKDEQNGKPPESVAKVVLKILKKKNPPSRVTVGFGYKCIVLLQKILPRRVMLWVVKKLYG